VCAIWTRVAAVTWPALFVGECPVASFRGVQRVHGRAASERFDEDEQTSHSRRERLDEYAQANVDF
jgi:hypothetical protein